LEKKRYRRLILLEILIFFLLALSTALILKPLSAVMHRAMTAARENFIARSEALLGRRIRYGSLSPSIAGSLDLRDFSVDDPQKSLLAISRFTIRYSLWDLIRGKKTGAVRYMLLENPRIRFDVDEDRDLGKLFSGKGGFILPRECSVLVRDGELALIKNKNVLEIDNFSFDGSIRESRVYLDGRWHAETDSPSGQMITFNGSMEGDFAGDLSGGSMVFTAAQIQGAGFTVEPLGFLLRFQGDRIDLEKSPDGRPFEINAAYELESETFSAEFIPNGLVLGSLISFHGPWKAHEETLGLVLSGRASLYFREQIAYSFDLEARNENDGALLAGFSLGGAGNGESVIFSDCAFDFYRGGISYDGDIAFEGLRPRGSLAVRGFSLTGNNAVDGLVRFDRTGMRTSFSTPYLAAGGRSYSLSGLVDWEETGCSFGGSFFRRDADEYSGFSWKGSRRKKPLEFETAVTISSFSGGDILALARALLPVPQAGFLDDLRIDSAVSLGFDASGFSYRTGRLLVKYNDSVLSASLSGTNRSLTLDQGQLRGERSGAAFSARFDFNGRDNVTGKVAVSWLDYLWDLSVEVLGDTVRIDCNQSFVLTLGRTGDRWSGTASGAVPLPFRGRRAYLGLDASLRYAGPASWRADLGRLTLNSAVESFSLQGYADQNGLSFDRIRYEDALGPLEGNARAGWKRDFSAVEASLLVQDQTGLESYSAELGYDEKEGDGGVEFQVFLFGARLDRFIESARNVQLSGELRGVANRNGYYSLNVSVDSLSGRRGENSYNVSAMLFADNERCVLSGLRGSFGEVDGEIPYFTVDRAAGHLETEARFSGSLNGHTLGVDAVINANFRPAADWLNVSRALETFSGVVELRGAFIDETLAAEPFAFVVSRTQTLSDNSAPASVLRVSGGPDECFNLEWQSEGPFTVNIANPSPVQATISGIFGGAEIDALATDVYIDLSGLWDIIPVRNIVDFSGGFISGETKITGSVFDPEFNGAAWGSGVSLSVPDYVAAEIGPGSGAIKLEGSEISFGPVAARCGEGGGIVEGWVRFSRWVPSLGISIRADAAIPLDFDIMGIAAKGNASGTVDFLFENKETFTIIADLYADDTDLTLDTGKMASAEANRLTDLDVIADVRITAGRRVEFLWPNADTPFLRAYGDAGTSLHVTGDTRVPVLTLDGDLALRGGEIFYLQRNFYLREGHVVFNPNESGINPRISARAEIRDRNEDGPVTISMVVDNQPLSTLASSVPRFESSPALSQLEIYALLGQSPTGAEAQNADMLLSTISDVVTQFGVVRRVERAIRKFLHLDMFSVRTQVLQNALFGAVRDRDTNAQNNGIGNYWDNTAVLAGKYVGSSLFLQGMLAFRYDQYQKTYGGLRLEPEFALDLRTPFSFDVRYSIRPEHVENLFINDQSVSIIWRWTL
jgi:hypothetical protein